MNIIKKEIWYEIDSFRPYNGVVIIVITKWGEREAISPVIPRGMISFLFTDTNHPMANVNCPGHEIQAWRFKNKEDEGKLYKVTAEYYKYKLSALIDKTPPSGNRINVHSIWFKIKTFFFRLKPT